MSAHAWFNRIWYGEPEPPFWLKPLSWLYGLIVRLRRAGYARRWLHSAALSRPVIVVGNLTVGGTGKTPLVCWLVGALRQRGYKPGIVTRGYGGSLRTTHRLQPSDRAESVGDEPLLLLRRTGVPVMVGRDRPVAAQALIEAGCDVIVSDDGLQHYGLERRVELVVVDGERGLGNGWLLPAGPLREGPERLASVTATIANGGCAPRKAVAHRVSSVMVDAPGGPRAVSLGERDTLPLEGVWRGARARSCRHRQPAEIFRFAEWAGTVGGGASAGRSRAYRRPGYSLRRRVSGAHDRKGCRKMRWFRGP